MTIKLAIDCMGGDHGVGVTIPAAIHFLAVHEDVEMLLVGQPDAIAAQLKRLHATANPRVHVVPASEVVSMEIEELLAGQDAEPDEEGDLGIPEVLVEAA